MEFALLDLWPAHATYLPGEPASLILETNAQAPTDGTAETLDLTVRLSWLNTVIAERTLPVAITPGHAQLTVPLELPTTPFRGYGITVTLHNADGEIVATRSTAVDVLESWAQAPRYGFLADFAPDITDDENRVTSLTRYHLNVAQFYDWMWRHYELMPPEDVFTDAMGRRLSLATTRARIAACHHQGIAAIGYAAVYGAEAEYADNHPDERIYDANGKPYDLGGVFYIMNIHRGNPWLQCILNTMANAVRDVPFDGLHLDQYGMPMEAAFDANGKPIDIATDFATFVDDARLAVQQPGREVGVIFNAVGNWPIKEVAPTSQDAVYIEVWPPDVDFSHLQLLIQGAHELAPGKQVILAAYMKPLGGADGETLTQAEAATRLTSATIWANGGFHLLLGERDGALCDAYYADYATLRPAFARIMRTYYDFVVRYVNVLSDRHLRAIAADDMHIATDAPGIRLSTEADPGAIWTITRRMPGYITISFINLTAASHAHWNDLQQTPDAVATSRLSVRLPQGDRPHISGIFCASPDVDEGAPSHLDFTVEQVEGDGVVISFDMPPLHYWNLLVIKTDQDTDSE
ncbi:MAG TPA: glycoside hydrolase family 66 protein [Ktedonobacterales bacterium]|nr:glycoside hydrolase family 66 protein [Ktedonobacterales bacterium]